MSNIIITIDNGDGATDTDLSSTTNVTPEPPKKKRKWTSSKEKNSQRKEYKADATGEKKRRDGALSAAVVFMDYAETINRKVRRNQL